MENGLLYALLLIIFLPVGFIMSFIPYFTRKTESFGVSISETIYSNPELKKLRKEYAISNIILWVISFTLLILFTGSLNDQQFAIVMSSALVAVLCISFIIYYIQHRRMKKLKAENNWSSPVQSIVIDTSFRKQRLTHSNLWFIPHVIVAVLTLGIGLVLYDQFPETLVTKYDLQGNPINVVEKSYLNVLWPVGLQLFMIVLFWFINYVIAASKQQIDAAQPEKSTQQSVIFRRKWSAFTIITGFLMTLLFSFILLSNLFIFDSILITGVPLLLVAIILVYCIWLTIKVGQGGSRVRPTNSSDASTGVENVDDDRYWKLGVIYINPQDPALFVEKRFGVGWTVNLGRPLVWILALGFILLTFAIILLSP